MYYTGQPYGNAKPKENKKVVPIGHKLVLRASYTGQRLFCGLFAIPNLQFMAQ